MDSPLNRSPSHFSALDRLTPTSLIPVRASRFDEFRSEGMHRRRRRWSPYARKRKLIPKRSFSLETIPPLAHIERQTSMELISHSCTSFVASKCHLLEGNEVDYEVNQTSTDWNVWRGYAKLMKLAWRRTRDNVLEQTHRAENCDLQAKSTLRRVLSMKSQLKADISNMREYVKKIHNTGAILDSLQDEKTKLQAENELLKSKLACLQEEKTNLNQAIFVVEQESENDKEKVEALKIELNACLDEMLKLEQEKVVVDNAIQELFPLCDQAKENLTVARKNLYNRELEKNDIRRELEKSRDQFWKNTEDLEAITEKSRLIHKEIETAVEGGKALQEHVGEKRQKVLHRDTLIAELRAKVATASEQIAVLKNNLLEAPEKRSWWGRFSVLSETSRSLISFKLD